ncbi:hypothetical protein QUR79_00495 [Arcobacter cryaerophilus gv. pseudocryaerophilus]|uniref:Uncharacterized protein n=1 Tax=Arcobacter cryaerophilus gv. pseudocryaerophilus TaxID=2933791 RepID=A0AAU0P3Y5_9BACT|nr:hypothetical protein QUR79_00495 [Arcobacter sp. DSM 115972]
MDNIGNNIEKKDFTSEEVFSARLIYAVLLDRDGNELYNIRKNSINGRKGVLSKTEFTNLWQEMTKDTSQSNFILGGKYSEVSEEIKKSLPKAIN